MTKTPISISPSKYSTQDYFHFSNRELKKAAQIFYEKDPNIDIYTLKRIFYKLGLRPQDLLETTKSMILKQSEKLNDSLHAQDIEFYTNYKYQKLEKRRKKIISQVLMQYDRQMETTASITKQSILTQNADEQKIIQNNQYFQYKEQLQNRRYELETRRIKNLQKNNKSRLQQMSLKQSQQRVFFQKLEAAQNRRQMHRSFMHSEKAADNFRWTLKSKQSAIKIKETEQQIAQKFKQNLSNKLKKAYQSRIIKQKELQKNFKLRNDFLRKKSLQLESIQQSEFINLIKLKSQIQQDLKVHQLNYQRLQKNKLSRLKRRQRETDQKIDQIRLYNENRRQYEYQTKLRLLNQKDIATQSLKKQKKNQLLEYIMKKRYLENQKAKEVETRRFQTEHQMQLDNKKIMQTRSLINSQIIQRKKMISREKRRHHIQERINNEIFRLNNQRNNLIQSRQIQQVEEHLQTLEQRYNQFLKRKLKTDETREKMKKIFRKKRQEIREYYDCKSKDFSKIVNRYKINTDPTEYNQTSTIEEL